LFEIEKLLKESVEFPEGEKTIVRRIIDREYQTLKGFEMDVVWSRVNTEAEERLNQFANEIAYIKMKTEEINEISADF
jgi:predicted DNA-binding antitoxin AbrB/MazE fold protein